MMACLFCGASGKGKYGHSPDCPLFFKKAEARRAARDPDAPEDRTARALAHRPGRYRRMPRSRPGR